MILFQVTVDDDDQLESDHEVEEVELDGSHDEGDVTNDNTDNSKGEDMIELMR